VKIATFNINDVNKRPPVLLGWLRAAKPDVVCLQELKAAQAEFRAGQGPDRVTRTRLPGDAMIVGCVCTERQPAAGSEVRLQAGLVEATQPPRRHAARERRTGGAGRRGVDVGRHLSDAVVGQGRADATGTPARCRPSC
jgi:endonuclease/exonuclease/phosphatase family metal-dependent hydrolase